MNEIWVCLAILAFSCCLFKGRQKAFLATVATSYNRYKCDYELSFRGGVSVLAYNKETSIPGSLTEMNSVLIYLFTEIVPTLRLG